MRDDAADMGAEVIRIDRYGATARGQDVLGRGRKSIALDLKNPEAVDVVLKLCESADALFEGFRPGVTERLGLGPEDCMARNPKLVYGRMTGWGQEGPMAQAAGHDINYISLAVRCMPSVQKTVNLFRPLTLWVTLAAAECCWLLVSPVECSKRTSQAKGR